MRRAKVLVAHLVYLHPGTTRNSPLMAELGLKEKLSTEETVTQADSNECLKEKKKKEAHL